MNNGIPDESAGQEAFSELYYKEQKNCVISLERNCQKTFRRALKTLRVDLLYRQFFWVMMSITPMKVLLYYQYYYYLMLGSTLNLSPTTISWFIVTWPNYQRALHYQYFCSFMFWFRKKLKMNHCYGFRMRSSDLHSPLRRFLLLSSENYAHKFQFISFYWSLRRTFSFVWTRCFHFLAFFRILIPHNTMTLYRHLLCSKLFAPREE